MSISCLRIKSSRRSSGPSKAGTLMRYGDGDADANSVSPGGFACLVPLEDRVPHALHGAARGRVGLLSAGVEDIPNPLRMRLEFLAACLNRLDPGEQIFSHQLLAIPA